MVTDYCTCTGKPSNGKGAIQVLRNVVGGEGVGGCQISRKKPYVTQVCNLTNYVYLEKIWWTQTSAQLFFELCMYAKSDNATSELINDQIQYCSYVIYPMQTGLQLCSMYRLVHMDVFFI